MDELIDHWRAFDVERPPFIHPLDRDFLTKHRSSSITTIEEYVASEYFGKFDSTLQLGLLPTPYGGDLSRASIFVVLLNPGFDISDFARSTLALDLAMQRTLRQQDLDHEPYPFIFLNPQFASTGGYQWWEGKLRDVLLAYVAERKTSYREALQLLSSKLAAVELFPYASVSRPAQLERLHSAVLARNYVRSKLAERARRGEVLLIITRQVSTWGVDPMDGCPDIVLYDRGQARGASLSTTSPGGKAILRRMLESAH